MSETKTHWKKMHNPDYLGAYALDPGKDLIVTIKQVKVEKITNCDGRKEDAPVMRFEEKGIKPMILNSTNSKTITKIYKTPYLEDWAGKKIQIFSDNIKAFGEEMEALRIRPYVPKILKLDTKCFKCSKEVEATEKLKAEQVAKFTYEKFGQVLCAECATALKNKQETEKGKDVL